MDPQQGIPLTEVTPEQLQQLNSGLPLPVADHTAHTPSSTSPTPDADRPRSTSPTSAHKGHLMGKIINKFFNMDAPREASPINTPSDGTEILNKVLAANHNTIIPADDRHSRETEKAIVNHPSLLTPTHARRVQVTRVLLLYNPESGAHQGVKIAESAKDMFLKAGIEVHAIALERRNHGEELCKQMDLRPYDVLCFIGGDGTFHECVNGLMKRADNDGHNIPVAMIAAGTGNSFALELVGSTDMKTAVETIKRGVHVPIDIGKVSQLDLNTQGELQKEVIYSFNSIHWGLGSKVIVTAERLRWMGKAVRYTTAALYELFNGNQTHATIKYEDGGGKTVEYNDEFCLVIANNVVVAAKGMKMAPKAKLNDGLLDLLIIRSQKILDLMNIFTHVYNGTHTDLSYVEYVQVKWFSIVPFKQTTASTGQIMLEADPQAAEELVDIDGELKGATPFRCEMIPGALKVIV